MVQKKKEIDTRKIEGYFQVDGHPSEEGGDEIQCISCGRVA